MKKILVIISWISFLTMGLAMALISLWVAAYICNRLADVLQISGTLWALCLVPIMFVTAWAVCEFFILGIMRFAKGFNEYDLRNI